MDFYDSDFDGVEEISAPNFSTNGASTSKVQPDASQERVDELKTKLTTVNDEITSLESKIKDLQNYLATLNSTKRSIQQELQTHNRRVVESKPKLDSGAKGKQRAEEEDIDYADEFPWSGRMQEKLRKIFGIDKFRLCQEAVCNANMAGRDIICVMPTGGGKSLTYQLPAILSRGCTLVISPLIALMHDQVLHMHEANVNAVKVTSAISNEEHKAITTRLKEMAEEKPVNEIKLCYVTPEKMARSNAFVALLQKLSGAGKLARIVIDEAHCVSQMGHDFRPDYQKLTVLRTLFPSVPIQALSATCPPAVVRDLVKVLKLRPLVDGRRANPDGTVYFTSPLYRKNLHYKVLAKPFADSDVVRTISQYILNHHAKETGIVYCCTKNDAQKLAGDLGSDGILAGVYHADIGDAEKTKLHSNWREGKVQVVCATIAFGMGIDKSDVRFVIHHTMSKSVDAFYQESGRAGRDGKDAACILYYRPQDMAHIMQLSLNTASSVYPMLRFAQDVVQCRKIHFAKHFAMSSSLSLSSWTTQGEDVLTPCGHCDNCTRDPATLEEVDVTLHAWRILKVLDAIKKQGGRVTFRKLADLSRGTGKGLFGIPSNGKQKETQGSFDIQEVANGPVTLSKTNTELLCIHLLLEEYIKVQFTRTAYSVNIYAEAGKLIQRLIQHSYDEMEKGIARKILYTFTKADSAKNGRKPRKPTNPTPSTSKGSKRSRKRKDSPVDSEPEAPMEDAISSDEDYNDFDSDAEGWVHSMHDSGTQSKPSTQKQETRSTKKRRISQPIDEDDIICLSSD